jgi:hypothetical protein
MKSITDIGNDKNNLQEKEYIPPYVAQINTPLLAINVKIELINAFKILQLMYSFCLSF